MNYMLTNINAIKVCKLLYMWHIARLRINLSLTTVQLSPPIFGKFCEKLIFSFSPKYLGLPVPTKYFVKNVCLCLEEGLHFCCFNLTLGHFYTFNTWNSQTKNFPQSCRYGKYHLFATLVTPITGLGAEKFSFLCNVFFPPNFSWRSSEHEQKPKLVFVEAE